MKVVSNSVALFLHCHNTENQQFTKKRDEEPNSGRGHQRIVGSTTTWMDYATNMLIAEGNGLKQEH